jgi:hypothetical protein
MTGPLAHSGNYAFTNMTGDIILALPPDASFQLNAKVSEKRDIVSDFQLKYFNEMPPPPPATQPGAAPQTNPAPYRSLRRPARRRQRRPDRGLKKRSDRLRR